MQLFINDIVLNVKIGNKKGPKIHTNFGICQGNYLSSPLFILYLSHAVKPLPSQIGAIDYGNSLWFILEQMINRDENKINIDPKYTDDISFLKSDESKINQIERIVPSMLIEKGLVN